MDATAIDSIRLNFKPESFFVLNIVLGLLMFGVALGIRRGDFSRVLRTPKAPAAGLLAQLLLLPAVSYLLTMIVRPAPSMALGMLLVAACPGGNFSNVITHLARGNAAISVTMTAFSTALAALTTPANLALWGSLNPHTAPILRAVRLDPTKLFINVATILGAPMLIGIVVQRRLPKLAARLERPFRWFSLLCLASFIGLALAANWKTFVAFFSQIFFVVVIHNAVALGLGYLTGRIFRLSSPDLRAVTIEVGIQNSGLGLVLIFAFFDGLGGMAVVAGMWGVWHLISGLGLASIWPRIAGEKKNGTASSGPLEAQRS